MRSAAYWLVLGSCLGGCTRGPGDGLSTVRGALDLGEAPGSFRYEVGAEITGLASHEGRVLVATTAGLWQVSDLEVRRWQGRPEPGATSELGAVRALASHGEELLLAAESGLFHLSGSDLSLSPGSAAVDGLEVVAMSSAGPEASSAVWLATTTGLVRLHDGALQRVDPPVAGASPTAVAALTDRVLVAFDARLYELDPVALTYQVVSEDLGAITQITAAGTDFLAATERGLLVRAVGGPTTLYTLRDADPGAAVEAVGLGATGRIVGLSEDGLFSVTPQGPRSLGRLSGTASHRALAVDDHGDTWVGSGTELVTWLVGEPVGFEADVRPILERRCSPCHATGDNGAPKQDLTDYRVAVASADLVLARLKLGEMPPSNPLYEVGPEEYATLIRWYKAGRAP